MNTRKPIKGLQELQGLYDVTVTGSYAEFEVDTDKIDEPLRLLLQFDIADLITSPPTLEDLFMRHYGSTDTASHTNGKALV